MASAYRSARERINLRNPPSPPAKASVYALPLDDLLVAGKTLRVVLHCRTSSRTQESMESHVAWCRRQLALREVVTMGVVREVGSGWKNELRPALLAAVELARRYDAMLVFESFDRYVRSLDYDSVQRPDAWPTVHECEQVRKLTSGVTVATILHPDTNWREVRAHQSNRDRPCPIGEVKRLRDLKLQRVLHLARLGGSLSEIEDETNVPQSTIARWKEQHRLGVPFFAAQS